MEQLSWHWIGNENTNPSCISPLRWGFFITSKCTAKSELPNKIVFLFTSPCQSTSLWGIEDDAIMLGSAESW